eukprot:6000788-Alexandrium_andersonii.AAC.1
MGRDRSRSLPRTPDGLRAAPSSATVAAAVATLRPPLQTTLHRWGVWHGDTNAYDARRIRQYQDH